jgi:transposase
MHRDVDALRDDQWERLRDMLPGGRAGQRGSRCDNRRFVDTLLWMARSVGDGVICRNASATIRPC